MPQPRTITTAPLLDFSNVPPADELVGEQIGDTFRRRIRLGTGREHRAALQTRGGENSVKIV